MRTTFMVLMALMALAIMAAGCGTSEGEDDSSDRESFPGATAQPAATALSISGSRPVSVSPSSSGSAQDEGFNQIGGSATVNDEPYDLTFFQSYGVNPFVDTEDDRYSTFAMDVDTASYVVTRTFLTDGYMPDRDSVRVEEFVNYFEQDYAAPDEGAFSITIDGSPSQFGLDTHHMIRVGLQGKTIADEDRKDATLIFTIDVSGSMDRQDRLGLVKRSLNLLVDELRDEDKVGIVIYGSTGRIHLEPTSGENKRSIKSAIDRLQSGGSHTSSRAWNWRIEWPRMRPTLRGSRA